LGERHVATRAEPHLSLAAVQREAEDPAFLDLAIGAERGL